MVRKTLVIRGRRRHSWNDPRIFGKFVSIIRDPFSRDPVSTMRAMPFDVSISLTRPPLSVSLSLFLSLSPSAPLRSFALPCAHIAWATGVVINLVVALTADGDHDIRNVGGSGVFVLSPLRQQPPIPPVAEKCRPRNQFHTQIPYLRTRRNRRFELIVDELFFLPLYPSLSLSLRISFSLPFPSSRLETLLESEQSPSPSPFPRPISR